MQHLSCKPTLLAVDGAELARNDVVFDLGNQLGSQWFNFARFECNGKAARDHYYYAEIKRFKCDGTAVQPHTMCTPAISTLIPLDTSSAAATLVDNSSSSMVDISLATSADNAEERARLSYLKMIGLPRNLNLLARAAAGQFRPSSVQSSAVEQAP